ncbi:MAG TPA: DUF4190 domain-containing protein [Pseudonocardiaceae bacterium]|nr:DUF4190 domain-containing protein [Pseudonocardiaceae bacterium]
MTDPQEPFYQAPPPQQMGYQGPPMGYQGPGYGYPVAQPTSGMCVAGMVLGILAVVGFWIPFGGLIVGIIGLILSIVGMRQARFQGRSGFGMGVTGLVCSLVSLIPAVILLVLFFSAAASCVAGC